LALGSYRDTDEVNALSAGDWAVLGFAAIYSAVGLLVRRRAARHFRPGVSAWTRRGIGWGMLRSENYTEDGQRARRLLVILWLGALPAFVLVAWLISKIGR
jgi:hypothetical protein